MRKAAFKKKNYLPVDYEIKETAEERTTQLFKSRRLLPRKGRRPKRGRERRENRETGRL